MGTNSKRINIEQERADFEAWAIKERIAYRDEKHGVCFYNGERNSYWIGYQAGRAALQSQERETCSWSYDESDGAHQTSCGNMHIIIDGTPDDNGMKYCCYCGGRITPAIDHARRVEGDGK